MLRAGPARNAELILTNTPGSFAVGDWLVEPSMNRISTTSETIQLRQQLMEVLVYLADLDGEVATLESIHDDLWSGKVVTSGAIYNCIAELRQAFASSGENIEYIETLPKKGYRLAPPIVSRQINADSERRPCSIVIQPLVNRSNDTAIEYLCEGISDEILLGLSSISGLAVYSAISLKEEKLDARVVGLRFGAQMVLSGSLQVSDQKLRVMFQLENVADGEILWSGRFDQTRDDVLELQDDVARQVLLALAPALPAKQAQDMLPKGSGTQSIDALNAFLLGKHAFSRATLKSYDDAIGFFERAIAIDPSFARAHYRLYLANYLKRRAFGIGQGTLDKAKVAAENARKYGYVPAVPWIHIQRRLYRKTRLSSRELGLEAIEKLRARDVEWGSFAYEQLTWVLADAGFFTATLDFAKQMLESPDHNFEDSDADEEVPHYTAACGYFDKAIRLWSSLIQKEPARPHFRGARCVLYSRTGQYAYATKDIEVIDKSRYREVGQAFLSYYQGDERGVLRSHENLLALPNIHPTNRLWSYCLIGDLDSAMIEYEKSVSAEARSYMDFGNVRAMSREKLPMELVTAMESHPRFAELLEKEGVDDAWREELMQSLNSISDITGIVVRPDPVAK
jgi:TolB-like protein